MTGTAGGTSLKGILLATDLKTHTDRAEARAFRLARELGADLHVIVVDEGQPQVREGREGVERYLRNAHGDLPFKLTLADIDDPSDAILDQAYDARCNLVVVGPKGRRTLKEHFTGGTLERLIAEAVPPLLVVQTPSRASYDEIVVATDFSGSSRYALETCAAILPDARFVLLHAFRVGFEGLVSRSGNEDQARAEASKQMDAFIARLDPALRERVRSELVYGAPEEAIAPYVQKAHPQLTLVGSHGLSNVLDKMLGDIAFHLLRNLPGDILLIREPHSAREARKADKGS